MDVTLVFEYLAWVLYIKHELIAVYKCSKTQKQVNAHINRKMTKIRIPVYTSTGRL